jgi:hypothetical protein
MREGIGKYRAKTLEGEWVFGSLVRICDGRCYIVPVAASVSQLPCNLYEKIANPMYPVDPETVGGHTGCADMDGVNIFEGDMIQYGNYPVEEVHWLEGSWVIGVNYSDLDEYAYRMRVVGKIHEKGK